MAVEGWVWEVRSRKLGRQACLLLYLVLQGKRVLAYKKKAVVKTGVLHENSKVEDRGRENINGHDYSSRPDDYTGLRWTTADS
ncbi:hypothetical protein CBR_g29955 [Chara braunii]|uniref:Uncharacterized protein n=1 Tax=Chara braunii TaxID=69332 RepID=A0A388LBK0_CHABU|nr:hypothetical protein CBR_g29955 [Chara braunii]|eukprot:GBG79689.1 hypothetical protein CBR_g29955 [Chara braunii]